MLLLDCHLGLHRHSVSTSTTFALRAFGLGPWSNCKASAAAYCVRLEVARCWIQAFCFTSVVSLQDWKYSLGSLTPGLDTKSRSLAIRSYPNLVARSGGLLWTVSLRCRRCYQPGVPKGGDLHAVSVDRRSARVTVGLHPSGMRFILYFLAAMAQQSPCKPQQTLD